MGTGEEEAEPEEDKRDPFSRWLDVGLDVFARLAVLALLAATVVGAYMLLTRQHRAEARTILRIIDSNWRACALLILALFYRPVRLFWENAEELPFNFRRGKRVRGEPVVAQPKSEPQPSLSLPDSGKPPSADAPKHGTKS